MKIELVEYQEAWPELYKVYRQRIANALKDINYQIEHIGSTSVPGLMAKPVIDIQIGLHAEAELDLLPQPMMAAGFTYNQMYEAELPYRRFFNHLQAVNQQQGEAPLLLQAGEGFPNSGYRSICNIHCVPIASNWWVRHLAFRDLLRKDDKVRDAYAAMKLRLAKKDWNSTADYADAKTAFIRKMEDLALGN